MEVDGGFPKFISPDLFIIAENQTAVGTVDIEQSFAHVFSIDPMNAGADGSKFSITAGGELKFKSAPDYETPASAATPPSNTYEVIVTAKRTSGMKQSSTQTITVTVTDVDETVAEDTPMFSSPNLFNVPENQTAVGTVTIAQGFAVAYSIDPENGGADGDKFSITTGGVLTFVAAPDFEMPGSVAMTNSYQVIVTASRTDGSTKTNTQSITVTVTDVDEDVEEEGPVFNSPSSFNAAENQTAVGTVSIEQGYPHAFSIDPMNAGADGSKFAITADGVLTFKTAPDYENPASAATPPSNTYEVIVTATRTTDDASGTQTILVTVTDVEDETPGETPAPSNVALSPRVDGFIVSVTPPAVSGILGYSYEHSKDGVQWYSMQAVTTQAVLVGLASNTQYQIRVAAVTQMGIGQYSNPVVGTTLAAPVVPTTPTSPTSPTVTQTPASFNGILGLQQAISSVRLSVAFRNGSSKLTVRNLNRLRSQIQLLAPTTRIRVFGLRNRNEAPKLARQRARTVAGVVQILLPKATVTRSTRYSGQSTICERAANRCGVMLFR